MNFCLREKSKQQLVVMFTRLGSLCSFRNGLVSLLWLPMNFIQIFFPPKNYLEVSHRKCLRFTEIFKQVQSSNAWTEAINSWNTFEFCTAEHLWMAHLDATCVPEESSHLIWVTRTNGWKAFAVMSTFCPHLHFFYSYSWKP